MSRRPEVSCVRYRRRLARISRTEGLGQAASGAGCPYTGLGPPVPDVTYLLKDEPGLRARGVIPDRFSGDHGP
jgi:hypothetical protein